MSKDLPIDPQKLKSVWKNPIHLIAFWFGSGFGPLMPGTFGTAAAIPFYLLLSYLPLLPYTLVVLIAVLVSIWICDWSAKDLGVHDYKGIVLDEVVGYWVTMIGAPKGWFWVIWGFLLFRLFDIWKPWPISWMDREVKGGLGIVLDDIAAAILAAIVLQLTRFSGFIPF